MITDADVARLHPELPALALVLDAPRLAAELERHGLSGYRLDRLRIKPGASMSAMLRPATGAGPWILARGFAPEPWDAKRDKEEKAAHKAKVSAWECPDNRLMLITAAADRSIPGLARLRPDTGRAKITWPVDGTRLRATVRTLSHNPSRRWVGLATTDDERWVLRLHHNRPAQVLPWQTGRMWRPGDPWPDILTSSEARARLAGFTQRIDLCARVDAAVLGLRMLHEPWGDRAATLARCLHQPLGRMVHAPAHGDLTFDQVVVDDGRASILDWDEAGLWPVGWDAATWVAGLIVAGWDEAGIVEPYAIHPAVAAAAAILRGPEPFRRRWPDWVARTEALLDHAERRLLQKAAS